MYQKKSVLGAAAILCSVTATQAAPICEDDAIRDVDDVMFHDITTESWGHIVSEVDDWFNLTGSWDDDGRAVPLDHTRAFGRHLYASILARHGVAGQTPPTMLTDVPGDVPDLGEVFLYGGLYVTNNWNRGHNEYNKLVRSGHFRACQGLNLFTGERFCRASDNSVGGYLSRWFDPTFDDGYREWGHEVSVILTDQITHVGSVINPQPVETEGARAQHQRTWSFQNGWEGNIQYSCDSMRDRQGSVFAARVIIHENWHRMGPNHNDAGGECKQGDGACDTFKEFGKRHPVTWESMVDLAPSLQPYQIDHRFLCDLTTEPNDWVPLMASEVAAAAALRQEDSGRFKNLPEGRPPYSCGPVSNVRVVLDANTCLNGRPICSVDSDCGDATLFDCDEGCCNNAVIVR